MADRPTAARFAALLAALICGLALTAAAPPPAEAGPPPPPCPNKSGKC